MTIGIRTTPLRVTSQNPEDYWRTYGTQDLRPPSHSAQRLSMDAEEMPEILSYSATQPFIAFSGSWTPGHTSRKARENTEVRRAKHGYSLGSNVGRPKRSSSISVSWTYWSSSHHGRQGGCRILVYIIVVSKQREVLCELLLATEEEEEVSGFKERAARRQVLVRVVQVQVRVVPIVGGVRARELVECRMEDL